MAGCNIWFGPDALCLMSHVAFEKKKREKVANGQKVEEIPSPPGLLWVLILREHRDSQPKKSQPQLGLGMLGGFCEINGRRIAFFMTKVRLAVAQISRKQQGWFLGLEGN